MSSFGFDPENAEKLVNNIVRLTEESTQLVNELNGAKRTSEQQYLRIERYMLRLEIANDNMKHLYFDTLNNWDLNHHGDETRKRHILLRLNQMVDRLADLNRSLKEKRNEIDACNVYQSSVEHLERGRPKYAITKEQLELLSDLNLPWVTIASLLGVSVATIWRRRIQLGISRKYRKASRQEIMSVIDEIHQVSPMAGIRMIEAELIKRNLKASQYEVRMALIDEDPIAAQLRWNLPVHRVRYQVKGPNSLWHMDGNLKLRRWKVVIHGCIDGYSRLCLYLSANDNNTSDAVLREFKQAVSKYCFPSRVRADGGLENNGAESLINEKWGTERRSFLRGSSVRNQRIERFWKDVRVSVTQYFKELFTEMEEYGCLDASNDVDVFCLHYVFQPRINRCLNEFKTRWNLHKLSSENNKTPSQLYISGMLRRYGSSFREVKEVFDNDEIDEEFFGNVFDRNAENLYEHDSDSSDEEENPVNFSTNAVRLSRECMNEIQNSVNPLSACSDGGIQFYLETRDIVSRYMFA